MTDQRPVLDPALFGEAPAREDRFTVVDLWAHCANFPDGHPEKPLEFFHRQMNEEANVMENVARNLAEFPEADWELRMCLARQCSDEARHAITYRRLIERRGARVGQYPVMNFQYRILSRIPHLIGRLAVQNRSFEADGMDAVAFGIAEARSRGDDELVELYEMQQSDEVFHVRFANDWIRRQIAESPRNVLAVSAALTHGSRAFEQVFQRGGTHVTKYGVAQKERLEAGFAPEEVQVAAGLAEARRKSVVEGRA
jgi:uncharacterized ferritin-like protein (DUF455 family)